LQFYVVILFVPVGLTRRLVVECLHLLLNHRSTDFELVLLLFQIVNVLEQLDILFHDQRLLLLMTCLILEEQVSVVGKTDFLLFALL